MIYPKPRRVNVNRMRRHRVRFGIMYQTRRINRDDLLDMGLDMYDFIWTEMLDMFRPKVLAHHMYDKYKWGKGLMVTTTLDYDIDRNQDVFRIEERKLI